MSTAEPPLALASGSCRLRRCIPRWRALAVWLVLLLPSLASSARAELPFVCPLDPYAYPEKCAKLARRAQKRQARNDAIREFREAHPWRVSALVDTNLFALGLGNIYVAGSWSVAAGVSVLHELPPSWALRMDMLARFGRGHISSWNVDDPGPIEHTTGLLGGAEFRVSVPRRMRALYLGPALAVGFLHLQPQTLRESDFSDESYGGDDATLRVPANAAFVAAGFVLGGEPTPEGRYSISLHFTPGVWNDMQHLYLSAAVSLTVKLWD